MTTARPAEKPYVLQNMSFHPIKKRLGFILLGLILFIIPSRALIIVSDSSTYRFAFNMVGKCGVAVGANHSSRGALVHMQFGNWKDLYWVFQKHSNKAYSIRNAATGQYITLSSHSGTFYRNIQLCDTLRGDSSLWLFDEINGGLAASSACDTTYRLTVWSGTMLVGASKATRPNTTTQVFKLYDRNGRLLEDEKTRRKNVSNYFESLHFGGVTPVYDKRNDLLLLSVGEEQMSRRQIRLTVDYEPQIKGSLYLNSTLLPSGTVKVFPNSRPGQTFRLTLRADTGIVAETKLTLTFMPVVELTGSNFAKSSFKLGSFRMNDGAFQANNDSLYNAYIRYRGNSTASKDKKAYALKLIDFSTNSINRSFHGLRNDNYWILDPMSIDIARMRNPSSFKLWNKYARNCYYSDKEPDRLKASRCFFVEVLLNGEYVGIYNMMERQDRKQFKLKKYQVTDSGKVVRGVMYKANGWNDDVKMTLGYIPTAYDNTKGTWNGWETQYPDPDDGEPFDWSVLTDAIGFVTTSEDKDFKAKIWNYFDEPVMIDYYLLIELMQGYDNMGKNIYYMARNIQKDRMLTIAPWDMDGTWGRDWNSLINAREDPSLDIDDYMCRLNGLYKRLLRVYPHWSQMLGERYCELRHTYFSEDSLLAIFNDNFNLFAKSGADSREEARWSGANNIQLDFGEERTYLNDWIPKRLAAIDKKYGYEPTGIVSTAAVPQRSIVPVEGGISVYSASDGVLDIYDTAGRRVRTVTLSAGQNKISLPSGIYIVDKRKVMVR